MSKYYGLIMPKVFPTGVFIESIKQTQTSTESGGKNIITASLTNHTKQTFEILNGAKGEKGDTGKAANIKEISATVDNTIGSPQVTVSELGTGSDKTVSFAFSGLKGEKGERGDVFINEEVKAYIKSQIPVMPVNPICAYDFADVQYKDVLPQELKNYKRVLAAASNDGYCYFYNNNFNAYLKAGNTYTITADFTVIEGNPTHATAYYYDFTRNESIYSSHTPVINGMCRASLTFAHTQIEGHNIQLIFYSGKSGYTQGVKSTWSNFKIETIADTQALDLSGNGNHANIAGSVEKVRDGKVGTVLKFNKGKLVRNPQDFIGVGKQWSHSRWVKIRPFNEQFQNEDPFLWYYGELDYCYCTIAYNGGIPGELYAVTRSTPNKEYFSLGINKHLVFSDKWVNIIVCVDLQPNKVKKIIYINGKKYKEHEKTGNFSNALKPEFFYDLGMGSFTTVGEMANLIFFDRLLTEQEGLWLYHNTQYPVKHYTNADEKLLTLFKNGYIQWNGMQLPDTVFNQAGYRWKKLHTYETHAVWQLEAV